MGWMETCAVDERMRFVMMVERQEETFAAVCRRFGVSRRTGYKWLARHQALGVEGLVDRSRAPLNHPQAVSPLNRYGPGSSDMHLRSPGRQRAQSENCSIAKA